MANREYILLVVAVMAVCVCGSGRVSRVPSRCFLPPKKGVCRAFIPAFYYDPLTGACDCFVYGGCLGNENRFSTLQECMDGCGVEPRLQKNTAACDRILQEQNPLATALDIIQASQRPHQQQPLEPQPQDLQQTLPLGMQPRPQVLQPQQLFPQTIHPQPQVSQPQLPFPQTAQPQPQVLQPQLPFPQTVHPQPQVLQPQQPFPQTAQPQPQVLQPQQPFPQTAQPQPQVLYPQRPFSQTVQTQQPQQQTQPQPQQPPPETPATTAEEAQVGYQYPVPSVVFTSSGFGHGTLFLGQPVLVPVRETAEDDDDRRPSC
ncbi:uncharacterized protein [Panulirus ornatus]|uniref:uncharacterized protein n=1 Tax=Panulirus ornatus TaxID=150431 RepID=UPI003A8C73F6